MEAIVVGAGIGGLATAAGLRQRGWDVTVVERAPELKPIGAGLAVAPNGLRALDTIGAGDAIRKLAAIQGDVVIRHPSGRVLARTKSTAVAHRFGEPLVLTPRSVVLDALAALVPENALRLGVSASGIEPGPGRPRLLTGAGALDADLIVAADGVNSVVRRSLFPEHPGAAYCGFTAWRMMVPAPAVECLPGETWGAGLVFGIAPMADGRVYAYAADRDEPGRIFDDEKAELLRRFGDWHAPIPELIRSAAPGAILHNDIYEMATPLPAYHRGGVAVIGDAAHAMTPHLGQGGNQAMEDAVTLVALLSGVQSVSDISEALAKYTALRLPRGTDMQRRSHRLGDLSQSRSRPKIAMRNFGMRVAGRIAPDLALRAVKPVLGWQPPELVSLV